jgi:hypothetical protein
MDGTAAAPAAKLEAKLVTGEAGYVLEDVPHVSDYLADLPVSARPGVRACLVDRSGDRSGERSLDKAIDR